MNIPDPIEIIKRNIDHMVDNYEEGVCMSCGKKVDYELYFMSPTGDGPAYCWECAGKPEF